MAAKTFGEAVATDLAVKAVICGPALVGAVLLGPVGVLLGAAATVALVASGGDKPSQPSAGDQKRK